MIQGVLLIIISLAVIVIAIIALSKYKKFQLTELKQTLSFSILNLLLQMGIQQLHFQLYGLLQKKMNGLHKKQQ